MTEEPESPIERSEILPVFPTFVWKLQLRRSLSERINSDVLARLSSVLETISPGQRGSRSPTGMDFPSSPA